jgi:hypothetical protein
MNEQDDVRWQNLLTMSAPTFAGEEMPPYGMVTRTLARLREETRQRELVERIGLRALFASLGILGLTAAATLGAGYFDGSDLEPGLNSFVQVENVQVS